MAKYQFIQDYTFFRKYAIDPSTTGADRIEYVKGDVIDGYFSTNQGALASTRSISTNLDGTLPNTQMIGIRLASIPLTYLKSVDNSTPVKIASLSKTKPNREVNLEPIGVPKKDNTLLYILGGVSLLLIIKLLNK